MATILLDFFSLDLFIAEHLYKLEGGAWRLRNSWLLENVIHNDGRTLVGVLLVGCLLALISTWVLKTMRAYRAALIYLFTAVAISLLMVSLLKDVTHVSCPWSFQRFGGDGEYAPIHNVIFGSAGGRCFPSGHSSGGYAWIALYFFCLLVKPQWRYFGLAFGLVLGLIFGVSQQLRGAHLLLHDVWTLAICWYVSLIVYHKFYRTQREKIEVSVDENSIVNIG